MKNFHRIIRVMIRRIQEREGFMMPVAFMSRWGLYDIDTAHELAREYAKTAGMSIKNDVARFDPVIAERVDTIVAFWRFVASAICCEDESYFRIVRKRYIEFFRKTPLDNGRRYR
nr:MAG TPA: hypothetical protein [Caudoviricetes sp.]